MSVLHRILEKACSDKSRSMSHIHPEQCAYFISYLSHPLIIPLPGICGSAADDKLRAMLFSQLLHTVVIDASRFRIKTIGHCLIKDS